MKQTNIKILDAPAGTGKTFVCVDNAVIQAANGTPVMFVQETINLIDETYLLLKQRLQTRAANIDVVLKKYYSKGGSPVLKEIIKDLSVYKNCPNKIVLITKKAFMELRSRERDFSEWVCYYDEFIEPFDILTLATEWESAKTFETLYEEIPGELGEYIEIKPSRALYDVVQQQPNDYTFRSMKEDGIIRALYSDYTRCFLHSRGKKMATFVTPELFKPFKEVTMLGAKINFHPCKLFWRVYELLPSDLQSRLRKVQHNGKVALGYFCEYTWTKAYKTTSNNMELISEALADNFKDQDYILVESEDLQQFLTMPRYKHSRHKGLVSHGADIIKCKVAGLNEYKDDVGAVFLNSMIMPDYWYRALKEIFNFSFSDVIDYEISSISYTAYQFILRTSIREPEFSGVVSAVVGSGIIARKVAEMIGTDKVLVEKLKSKLHDVTTPDSAFAAQRLSWHDEITERKNRMRRYINLWMDTFSEYSKKNLTTKPNEVFKIQEGFSTARNTNDIDGVISSLEYMKSILLPQQEIKIEKTLTPHELKLKEIINKIMK